MKMKKYIIVILIVFLVSCVERKRDNSFRVEKLPAGEYTIYNYGSRHIVRCIKSDGRVFYLNDNDFKQNGINGYDAHQYRNPTKVTIK
jgi:hypothetical protein